MKKFPTHPAKSMLRQLWEAKSKNELLALMHEMCTKYPELQKWIQSKQKSWILSGLTPEQSRIDYRWWIYARDHTGITESSHFQDNNFTGRKLSLLNAVLKYGLSSACIIGHTLIRFYRLKHRSEEMFKHNTTFSEQGVDTTWRDSSDAAHIAANMRRKGMISYAPHILLHPC